MNFRKCAVPLAGVAALVALGACSHEQGSTPGTTTANNANEPGNANDSSAQSDVALSRIAVARCAREMRCNNIGADKTYASNDECVAKVGDDMKDDLGPSACPSGIARRELDACVSAIRAENCGNVLDKIGRVTACRTSRLCTESKQPSS